MLSDVLLRVHRFAYKAYTLQVLIGKFNCFARAAAKGELPKSSPLHKAAAYDLDVLQKLAVAETTLVSWVEDVSRSLPQGWPAAGSLCFALRDCICYSIPLHNCNPSLEHQPIPLWTQL
jgi:hypothetical protein